MALSDGSETSTHSRPQSGRTEGGECQYSPRWNLKKEWLPWSSNGLEHGLKKHRVSPSGEVEEVSDPTPEPKKVRKSISRQQWERV